MAGRPRTTLKRIGEWEPLADRLYEEIRKRIPPAYLDYDADYTDLQDRNGLVLIENIPYYDDVAHYWKSALVAAEELKDSLVDLELVIRKRLEQRG